MPILKAGVLYFGLVFGVGFVLGAIRTLWVVPPVGTRMAEIMETSIMLVVTIVTARVVGSAPRCAVHALRSIGDGLRRASPHGRWGSSCSGFGACQSETISVRETQCQGRSTT